jgi:hypothetical protein
MKKIAMTAALVACAAVVTAQTVTSANIVGYSKVDKPGDTDLNIMGITFQSVSNKLSELCPVDQFNGATDVPGNADQLIIYTPGSGYATYAKYDVSHYPGYEDQVGWQAAGAYGFGQPFVDPVVPAGSSLWIKSAPGAGSTNVILSGEVVSDEIVTNSIVAGLQMISNPFSEAVKLDDLNLYENATGALDVPGNADQIIVYDAGTQGYTTYAFYDVRSYGYPENSGWKAAGAFGFADPVTTYEVQPGEGFWYSAKAGFTWVESNKYLSAFN